MIDSLQTIFNDVSNAGLGLVFVGSVIFSISYLFSRFFKWIVFRVILLLIGGSALMQILQQSVILFDLELYVALGLVTPHLHLVHVISYRIWYKLKDIYEKLVDIFFMLMIPFIWMYDLILKIVYFFQSKVEKPKQETHNNYHQKNNYKSNEKAYQQRKEEYKNQKKHDKQNSQQHSSTKEQNTTSRWESKDPYTILDLPVGASKKDIKLQYRKLMKIYHPDLASKDEEVKYTQITQKLNEAYSALK